MAEIDLLEWVRIVDVPVMLALAGMLIRHIYQDNRTAADQTAALNTARLELKAELTRIELDSTRAQAGSEKALLTYKLEAMQTFITAPTVNEMEGRITRHIESIERKLDQVLDKKD